MKELFRIAVNGFFTIACIFMAAVAVACFLILIFKFWVYTVPVIGLIAWIAMALSIGKDQEQDAKGKWFWEWWSRGDPK